MITPQYLAGLIDGEGYLGLLPSRVKGLKNQSFEPVVKIGMAGNESDLAFWLIQDKYGGIIEKRNKPTSGGRVAYTYALKSRKKVLTLLEDITPYLITKLTQAMVLQEFCKLPMTHSRHASFDKGVLEKKIELYTLLKFLKQPQPLATTN